MPNTGNDVYFIMTNVMNGTENLKKILEMLTGSG